MDYDAWTIGGNGRTATHVSGFSLTVEGNPRDPEAVNPGRFPDGLTAMEQVRLLRFGVEAIALASKSGKTVSPPVERKVMAPKAPKNGRPVLSMKSRTQSVQD